MNRKNALHVSGYSLPREVYVKKFNLLTSLPFMGKHYRVTFDISVRKFPVSDNASILHITTDDDNKEYGSRIPAIWLKKDKTLQIFSAVNGDKNYTVSSTEPLLENEWINVEIMQVRSEGKVIDIMSLCYVLNNSSTSIKSKLMTNYFTLLKIKGCHHS